MLFVGLCTTARDFRPARAGAKTEEEEEEEEEHWSVFQRVNTLATTFRSVGRGARVWLGKGA